MEVRFLPNCSHPAMGRNQLCDDFLKSDADKMFFLDSDITWESGAILKLCKFDAEIVGGAYRYKFDAENYPVGWLDVPELWANKDGLIEVNSLPGGFMAISREALEEFKQGNPGREYEHFGKTCYAFFQMPWSHGRLNGEDSFFCFEYRQAGGHVYLYPELSLSHWNGPIEYEGHIGNWLRERMRKAA